MTSKAKMFKGKHEPKLEFPQEREGGYLQTKKASIGEVWIFSRMTHFPLIWIVYEAPFSNSI